VRARGDRAIRHTEEAVTVGFYAPLPPAHTGVADYAAALLAEMRKHGRVEIAPSTCDVALYHLGNNALHGDIYRRALEVPGVVVLHDAVLHHFLLGFLDEAAYIEEFVYNYGEWNRGLARELWRGRASSATDRRYFDYPMLRRIVERSRAVVVHNPAAAQSVAEHGAGLGSGGLSGRVIEIPHLFTAPRNGASVAETIRWRQRAGVGLGSFVFGVFGYLRESKRLMTVLESFADVHRDSPGTTLLVAGEFVSTDLERAVEPMLSAPGVMRRPHLEEREFWLAAAVVDACINLRYPAAGETSGIAIRLMGLGKPVMLTESPECSRFPEDACIRIATGAAERDSLRDHMTLVAQMPQVAAAIGVRAAAYIHAHHGAERVAAQYWGLLREVTGGSQAVAVAPS
jgi:glycosyltransferase involved in cell wall biosynthesis